jgi:hypothetical protein
LHNRHLAEIWELLRKSEICVLPSGERFNGAFKTFLIEIRSRGQFLSASWSTALNLPAMHSSDSEQSSDDSGAGADPHQSSAVLNSLLQLQDDYASGSDEFIPVTPEKSVEEEDGQRTALISTRPLSLPSACAFSQSVQLKAGKLLFLNRILTM